MNPGSSVVVAAAQKPDGRTHGAALGTATEVVLLAGRNLRKAIRTPRLLGVSLALPVSQLVIFTYVLGGVAHVPGTSYREFVIPAVILQALAFVAMSSAVGVAEDMTSGLVDRLRSLPTSRVSYSLARSLSDGLRLAILAIALSLISLAVGFRFERGLTGALTMLAALWWFAVMLDAIAGWVGASVDPESAQMLAFVPILPLLFVSSAFAPIHSLPGWMQPFARDNPVSAVVGVARAAASGGSIGAHAAAYLAWTIPLFVGGTLLSARRYERS